MIPVERTGALLMSPSKDHYSRWSYRQLIVQRPHVRFEGLWAIGDEYFVVCPDYRSACASDGTPLATWFDRKCRVVTAPVSLVDAPPQGADRVPEHTLDESIAMA